MPAANVTYRPPLACDKCGTILPGAVVNTIEPVNCPGCHAPLLVEVFPAYFRPLATGQAAENVLSEEDASCFYHPAKRAVVPCGRCGRFLCALCDIELGPDRHVCPGCVEAARQAPPAKAGPEMGGLGSQQRTVWDTLALLLALMPCTVILWWTSFVSAPIALYLAIRHWNYPSQCVLPRSRVRLILAVFVASLQIVGWLVFAAYLYHERTRFYG